MIILVAAAAENNTLGKDNALPWRLPLDFKHFKDITSGHHIIMGRKTFESLPTQLTNRTHIVITRQKDYNCDGCILVHDLQSAIKAVPEGQDAYVVGGGDIFDMAIKTADKIELTRVHTTIDGDAFFPEIDPEQWKVIWEERHEKDEKHNFAFTFQTFVRK